MDIGKTNTLFNDGTLQELYQNGFISSKIFEYRQYYIFLDAQIRTRSISLNKAVLEAEVKFNRGRSTIYRSWHFFNR